MSSIMTELTLINPVSKKSVRTLRNKIWDYDGTNKEDKAEKVLAYLIQRSLRGTGRDEKSKVLITSVTFKKRKPTFDGEAVFYDVFAKTNKESKKTTIIGSIEKYDKEIQKNVPYFGEILGESFIHYSTLKDIKVDLEKFALTMKIHDPDIPFS